MNKSVNDNPTGKSSKNSRKVPGIPKKAQQAADTYIGVGQIKSDPMGSWTGRGINPDEIPPQDADDL